MLTQISMKGSKLSQVGKSLEQVDQKADSTTGKLDELGKRVEGLEDRTRTFAEIDKRIQTLIEAATQAQHAAEKLMAPDGELQKHRHSVQQLSSQALETQASIDTLKRERATLEELRGQLRQTHAEIKQTIEQSATVRGELDQVRGTAGQLAQDYVKLREASREAREDSVAASETVKDLEKKLGPLMQLQELSKTTEDKLTGLNSLAEHVSQKAKALESQKHAVERAVVEANRLNEMVWNMDVQITRLNEGLKQAARGEETVTKIEALVADTNAKVDAVTQVRDELARESSRFEKDGRALVDTMRGSIEKLGLEKKEFEAFDQRLRALQGAVSEAEARMDALVTKEKSLAQLNQKVDVMSKDFQSLSVTADELSRKQATLDTLHERLKNVDDLNTRTGLQYDTLKQSRQDLDVLRKDIQDFHKSHLEAAQLRDRLGADRSALEAFGDRMASFVTRTPQLEATMDAINAKLAMVDEGMKQATRLGEVAGELDAQLTRVSARVQFVDKLEGRINSLHVLTADVDRKLAEQLARRAEVETLKNQCDGVVTQMLDAQQKVEAVAALQGKVLPLAKRLSTLEEHLQTAQARFKDVQRDEAGIADQQAKLAELLETNRTLSIDTAERMKQVQALGEELGRSGAVKDELIGELARIQTRQRDAVAQVEATEDQLRRSETMFKQLEQRRTQLAFSEKKVAGVEIKMSELSQKAADLDQKIKGIAERDAVVSAVKAEVDNVHRISAQSRADLEYVTEHRDEVTALRRQVQELLATAAATEDKIAAIEARRKTVDEVQAKTNLISNLLEDVRVSLESFGEQKAVIDHVAEKLARMEFAMQEAQTVVRTLQHERELAERIEVSIRQLRSRTTKPEVQEGRKASA